MAKFLFTTLPTNDLGLLARSLPIAGELAKRGHDIMFCSPARSPRRLITEAGFENLIPRHPFYDLMQVDSGIRGYFRFIVSGKWRQRYGSLFEFVSMLVRALPLKNAPATPEVWNIGHAGAQIGMLNEGFMRANCDAYIDLVRKCGADIIVDFWNPFAVMAARVAGKPVVSVIQGDAHPLSGGYMWWKTLPPEIPTPVPIINKLLAEHHLPAISKFEDLSVGDLTLVVGTPQTDPLPENARANYIGAILWQSEQERLPDWINGVDLDVPLIWIYSGNPRYASANGVFDSLVVIKACIAALADENVQVVLTTGHHALPPEVLPLPLNFRHEAYLPGLLMAERSSLMIHHGGYGSCQTGLYTGTPSVVIPTFSERESNARRIAALGAGVFVPVDYDTGRKDVCIEDLRAAVRRVLEHPSYAENACRIGEKLRSYGGAPRAACLIEDFVQQQCKLL